MTAISFTLGLSQRPATTRAWHLHTVIIPRRTITGRLVRGQFLAAPRRPSLVVQKSYRVAVGIVSDRGDLRSRQSLSRSAHRLDDRLSFATVPQQRSVRPSNA
jgi:hypothetical protein